jgi:hypothetical protein
MASTGQVACGVLPPPSVPLPCDFVTGGGLVLTDTGKMANFGAHGGCKNEAFWGHVNYVDHNNEYHLNSIQITGLSDRSERGAERARYLRLGDGL